MIIIVLYMIILASNMIIIVSNMIIIVSTMIILAGWTAGCGAGRARHHHPGTALINSPELFLCLKQLSAVLWICNYFFRILIQDAS